MELINNKMELSKHELFHEAEVKEEFYLVKVTGSQGSVYDFSAAKVWTLDDINAWVRNNLASNPNIKYYGFDNRIGFHKWQLLGDFDGYTGQHLLWILSTSDKHPWLSQCTEQDLSI